MTEKQTPDVSVIIPVYKAQEYISQCAASLFNQTLASIQFIFIDDCTPDNSINLLEDVLKQYPQRIGQVTILRNSRNIGVGASRQKGMEMASGKYLIHCDPDDWIEPDMYRSMFEKAETEGADIVVCDFIYEYNNHSKYSHQIIPHGKKSLSLDIASGKLHMSMWNKLFSRALINKHDIKIPAGVNLWEDMFFSARALLCSRKTVHIKQGFYHYRATTPGSIVKQVSHANILSQVIAVSNLSHYLQPFRNADIILKFRAKDSYLHFGDGYAPDLWRETFPEVNCLINSSGANYLKKIEYSLVNAKHDKAGKIAAFFIKQLKKLRGTYH